MASEMINAPGSFGTTYGTPSAPDARGGAPLPDAAPIGAGNLGNVGGTGQKPFAELVQLASTLGAQPGISNGNGAPSIGNVTLNFSPEDMAAALLVLQGKTQDAQLRTAREGLESSRLKMQDQNERALAKINDWIKSCESAGAKDKAGGVMGWVAKIAGFVGALMATVVAGVAAVATGGAAAPLLALSIMGLIGATMGLASHISQECGGPPLELSSLMTKFATVCLTAVGVPADKVDAAARTLAGALGVISGAALIDPALLGELAGGITQLGAGDAMTNAVLTGVFTAVATIAVSVLMVVATGGAAATEAVNGIAKTVATAAKIGQAVAGITAGATSVARGGVQIAKAHDERDAALAQADKKQIDGVIVKLQQQMEDEREQIKKVIDEIMEGVNIVSQMINAAGDSRSQVTANLTGKGPLI
ncbi:MAG: type III secretion system translocon subunit SctE [Rhodocyclaceae bacterium]|nr:type III secretion system translocon subunit SctE [Rhodocyclaceae bacterium]